MMNSLGISLPSVNEHVTSRDIAAKMLNQVCPPALLYMANLTTGKWAEPDPASTKLNPLTRDTLAVGQAIHALLLCREDTGRQAAELGTSLSFELCMEAAKIYLNPRDRDTFRSKSSLGRTRWLMEDIVFDVDSPVYLKYFRGCVKTASDVAEILIGKFLFQQQSVTQGENK